MGFLRYYGKAVQYQFNLKETLGFILFGGIL